ncbi:hypothetical protein ABT072_08460 [Streptomyces sp. NPDC002589]|uniref:hypothetical protein n=1 Tax=Streptomyces sp. NPDC002589 TaxID=3154420 RepID=UPI0033173317
MVQAILDATSDPRVRESMLLGSRLESSWNPSSVGDQGTSFGPFQIHLPAHPGVTADQAQNPAWATRYMLSAYQRGAAAQPDSLWRTNPEQAAEQAAVAAEAPAQSYYAAEGAQSVNAAWRATVGALGGHAPAAGDASAQNAGWGNLNPFNKDSPLNPLSPNYPLNPFSPSNPLNPLSGLSVFLKPFEVIAEPFAEIGTLLTWWWTNRMKVAFICVGVMFFTIGLVFFAKDSL